MSYPRYTVVLYPQKQLVIHCFYWSSKFFLRNQEFVAPAVLRWLETWDWGDGLWSNSITAAVNKQGAAVVADDLTSGTAGHVRSWHAEFFSFFSPSFFQRRWACRMRPEAAAEEMSGLGGSRQPGVHAPHGWYVGDGIKGSCRRPPQEGEVMATPAHALHLRVQHTATLVKRHVAHWHCVSVSSAYLWHKEARWMWPQPVRPPTQHRPQVFLLLICYTEDYIYRIESTAMSHKEAVKYVHLITGYCREGWMD